MSDIAEGFLAFLRIAKGKGQVRDEVELVYDRIRRIYTEPEARELFKPHDPDAEPARISRLGYDPYQEIGMWHTFCESKRLDLREPPPERPTGNTTSTA